MCTCVFKFFFEITEPTEDKVHVGPPRDRGVHLFKSGQLLFFILILSASAGGAFSGDITTNLAR